MVWIAYGIAVEQTKFVLTSQTFYKQLFKQQSINLHIDIITGIKVFETASHWKALIKRCDECLVADCGVLGQGELRC